MKIEPKHLPIVNMALEQNPELAARLAEAIAALFPGNLIPAPGGTILTGGVPVQTPPAEKPQVPAKEEPREAAPERMPRGPGCVPGVQALQNRRGPPSGGRTDEGVREGGNGRGILADEKG